MSERLGLADIVLDQKTIGALAKQHSLPIAPERVIGRLLSTLEGVVGILTVQNSFHRFYFLLIKITLIYDNQIL